MLSLTSAKSGALVGVLISVTTIPAAANIGVAAALGDGEEWVGAMEQLALNLGAIFLACIGTLYIQRRLYLRRRRAHLSTQAREAAGLPLGRSRRAAAPPYRGHRRERRDELGRSPISGCWRGAFAGATAIAELLGAANIGTALTFGQLAFVGGADLGAAAAARRRR